MMPAAVSNDGFSDVELLTIRTKVPTVNEGTLDKCMAQG